MNKTKLADMENNNLPLTSNVCQNVRVEMCTQGCSCPMATLLTMPGQNDGWCHKGWRGCLGDLRLQRCPTHTRY